MNAIPGYDLRWDRPTIVAVGSVVGVGGVGVIAHVEGKVGAPEDGGEGLVSKF